MKRAFKKVPIDFSHVICHHENLKCLTPFYEKGIDHGSSLGSMGNLSIFVA